MQSKKRLIQDISYPSRARTLQTYRPTPKASRQTYRSQAATSPVGRRREGGFKRLTIAVVVFIVLAGGVAKFVLGSNGDNKAATESETAVRDAPRTLNQATVEPKEEAPKKIDTAAATQQIDAIIAKYPAMQISVSYSDLKLDAKLNSGVNEIFRAASTTKLITAIMFLHLTETGKYSLTQPLGGSTAQAQLQLLIEKSDNTAWNNFDSLLGTANIQQYARENGLTSYVYNRNVVTSAEMGLLVEKLYKAQLLNESNTKLLLSYMEKASETQYIRSAVPAGIKVYHKAGYLSDRAHDVAVIDDGKRPFVLVIFSNTKGQYSYTSGAQMMKEVTEVFLEAYKKLDQ